MRSRPGSWCAVLGLLVSGCGSGKVQSDDTIATTTFALTVPAGCATVDFDVDAPDGKSIALTFDDGPEYAGTTLEVLDILAAEKLPATFFINTNDAIDVLGTSSGRLAVQRMVAEGHEVGSHTVHHYSLADATTDAHAELSGVVSVLRSVAPAALAHRLVRAPYGEPYFGPQDALDRVAPIVAQYGVHIGWNIDSLDWACASATDPAACVQKNVLDLVDAGRSGIVLLHSTSAATVGALPALIAALRARGKTFVTVEHFVLQKYGKPSRRLFACAADSDCYGGDVCRDARCVALPKDSGVADTAVVVDTALSPDTAVTRDTAVGDTALAMDTAVASDTSVTPDTQPGYRLHGDGAPPAAMAFEPPDDEATVAAASDVVAKQGCGFARDERGTAWPLVALAMLLLRGATRAARAARRRSRALS